jgi:hypothetical protein
VVDSDRRPEFQAIIHFFQNLGLILAPKVDCLARNPFDFFLQTD